MSEPREITQRWRVAQRNLRRIWDAKKKDLGLTQEKAGDEFGGITQGAIGQYLKGRISLNERKVLQFAKLLRVHPTDIDPAFNLLPDSSHSSANGTTRLSLVPFVHGSEIRTYLEQGCDMGQLSKKEWIPSPVSVGASSFAFRMIGSSMEPAIKDGATVIVDPDKPEEHGSIVLIYSDETPEGAFRRLVKDGGATYLQAVNPYWPRPIAQATADVQIVGVAICTFGWL